MSRIDDEIEYRPFDASDVDGVVHLGRALEWPSYTDPAVARTALTAPGAVTWVAVRDGKLVGLAHLLTDGVVQAHLSLVGVLPECRRRGIARRLVVDAFRAGGGKWLDLCSEPGSEDFYRSFVHQERVGFRIHPTGATA